METHNLPITQIVIAIIAIVPGVLAYYGQQKTKQKVGDITQKMTDGFMVGAQPVESFQKVIEAQADELRRLRKDYAEDAAHWEKTEKYLRDELAKCRERQELLVAENAVLKVENHGLKAKLNPS